MREASEPRITPVFLSRDLPLQGPPGPKDLCGFEIDPSHQEAMSSHGDRTEHHGAHRSHVGSVLDGPDFFEFLLMDLLHVKGNTTQRHAAISEGKVFGLGNDQDVCTVHFQFMVDIAFHFLDEADQSHHRRYANEAAPQEQRGRGPCAVLRLLIAMFLSVIASPPGNRNIASPARRSATWMMTLPFSTLRLSGAGLQPPLDFIDAGRWKSLAAVVTDHEIAFLGVTFIFRPADIAGIKGSTDHTIGALKDEVSDGQSRPPSYR